MAVYNIPAFNDADQFLQLIAAARGKLGKVRSHWNSRCSNTAITTHDSRRCALDPAAGLQIKRCSVQTIIVMDMPGWDREHRCGGADRAHRLERRTHTLLHRAAAAAGGCARGCSHCQQLGR